MSDQIFQLAEKHGWLDDFGRWNFKDDGLINFVIAVSKAERDACARVCDEYQWASTAADEIRARGET